MSLFDSIPRERRVRFRPLVDLGIRAAFAYEAEALDDDVEYLVRSAIDVVSRAGRPRPVFMRLGSAGPEPLEDALRTLRRRDERWPTARPRLRATILAERARDAERTRRVAEDAGLSVALEGRPAALAGFLDRATAQFACLAVDLDCARLSPGELASMAALAFRWRTALYVRGVRTLDDLLDVSIANVAWAAGPALGGVTSAPCELGAPQRALLRLACARGAPSRELVPSFLSEDVPSGARRNGSTPFTSTFDQAW